MLNFCEKGKDEDEGQHEEVYRVRKCKGKRVEGGRRGGIRRGCTEKVVGEMSSHCKNDKDKDEVEDQKVYRKTRKGWKKRRRNW